jgi:PRTRC genetic system protein B
MEMLTPTPLTPCAVLAIYEGDRGGNYYIERHPVKNGMVHAGAPCTRKEMTAIAHAILDKTDQSSLAFRGPIPRNLVALSLRNSRKRLLWHAPAQQRTLYFQDSLGIPNGLAWQPDLLFYLHGDTLSIFGLRDQKINAEASVYLVPFHNTSDSGTVCMGNATVDAEATFVEDLMAEVEEAFYNSKFSHAGNLYTHLSFNINTFWKDLIQTQMPFPEYGLIRSKHYTTIGSLIAAVNSGAGRA